MLLNLRSPFKQEDHHHDQKQRRSPSSSCNPNHGPTNSGNKHQRKTKKPPLPQVGLRLVLQISSQDQPRNSSVTEFSCFLKACRLCNKGLRPENEVYMYRGDQGFCSIECRDRQIFIDEMQELEASTKKMVASYRNSCNPTRHQTCFLLEELKS